MTAEEYRAAFNALESLRLDEVAGVDLLLPHLSHAPALRYLTIHCTVCRTRLNAATYPSRGALRRLLTAAPRLGVRLEVPSIEEWRSI